jgi:hypothetical protein
VGWLVAGVLATLAAAAGADREPDENTAPIAA